MNIITPKTYKQGDPIPLHLECTVNGTTIYYDRLLQTVNTEYPGYVFYTDNDIPLEEAEEKIKILIDRICNDHEDYGVSWRTTSFKHIENRFDHMFEWHYRVRDSY